MDDEHALLLRRLERERKARKQAEAIAEEHSRDLYLKSQDLEAKNAELVRAMNLLETAYREVERLSTTDPLTGLSNRRSFGVAAANEVGKAARYHRPLSLVMIDIDHFKRVNDTFGHAAGDEILVAVAGACRRGARTVDHVARLGGEEFCLLLPETASAGAEILAERLRASIAGLRLVYDGRELVVTASFGIAEWREGDDFDGLLRRADDALYAAKGQGRDRVVVSK